MQAIAIGSCARAHVAGRSLNIRRPAPQRRRCAAATLRPAVGHLLFFPPRRRFCGLTPRGAPVMSGNAASLQAGCSGQTSVQNSKQTERQTRKQTITINQPSKQTNKQTNFKKTKKQTINVKPDKQTNQPKSQCQPASQGRGWRLCYVVLEFATVRNRAHRSQPARDVAIRPQYWGKLRMCGLSTC